MYFLLPPPKASKRVLSELNSTAFAFAFNTKAPVDCMSLGSYLLARLHNSEVLEFEINLKILLSLEGHCCRRKPPPDDWAQYVPCTMTHDVAHRLLRLCCSNVKTPYTHVGFGAWAGAWVATKNCFWWLHLASSLLPLQTPAWLMLSLKTNESTW